MKEYNVKYEVGQEVYVLRRKIDSYNEKLKEKYSEGIDI